MQIPFQIDTAHNARCIMMMSIYTVSFFGHRSIEHGSEIDKRLDKLLHEIIMQREYIDFLIGRDGEFDLLASAAIKRAVSSYGYGNTNFTLVFKRDTELDKLVRELGRVKVALPKVVNHINHRNLSFRSYHRSYYYSEVIR